MAGGRIPALATVPGGRLTLDGVPAGLRLPPHPGPEQRAGHLRPSACRSPWSAGRSAMDECLAYLRTGEAVKYHFATQQTSCERESWGNLTTEQFRLRTAHVGRRTTNRRVIPRFGETTND